MYDRIDLMTRPGEAQIIASTVKDFDEVFTGDQSEVFRAATEVGHEPSAWPVGDHRNSPGVLSAGGEPDDDDDADEDGNPDDEDDDADEDGNPDDEDADDEDDDADEDADDEDGDPDDEDDEDTDE